jgi:6-pyruvoyltetrahydropterin/6-carboxytetrahydropterin synthase
MFELYVRRAFDASHALRGPDGLCEGPHEHRFECEAKVEAREADAAGMAVDFRRLDAAMDGVVESLAGRKLHELAELEGASPSAENIARHIHARLAPEVRGLGARLVKVKVWEDPEHCAAYLE